MSSARQREPLAELGDHRRIGVRLQLEADDRLEAPLPQLLARRARACSRRRRRRARPRRRGRPGTGSRSRSPSPGRASARSRRSPASRPTKTRVGVLTPARTRSHCGSSRGTFTRTSTDSPAHRILEPERPRRREVRDERERMRRVEAQRRQHRRDLRVEHRRGLLALLRPSARPRRRGGRRARRAAGAARRA